MARPKKQISKSDFEKLCGFQCTKEEICWFLDVSDKTLDRWCRETYDKGFSEVFRQKRGLGKVSLRQAQFQAALKGNVTMLIWLGKQMLGQREIPEESIDMEDTDAFLREAGLDD